MTQEQLKKESDRQDRAIRSMELQLDDMARWIESQKRKDKKLRK
jgi:hypothetical protein